MLPQSRLRAVLDFIIAEPRHTWYSGSESGDERWCWPGTNTPHPAGRGQSQTLSPHCCSYHDIWTNMLALFPPTPSEMSEPLCSYDRNPFWFLLGFHVARPVCAAQCIIWISESVRRWPENLSPCLLALHTVKCGCWWNNAERVVREEAEMRLFSCFSWVWKLAGHWFMKTFILTDHYSHSNEDFLYQQ